MRRVTIIIQKMQNSLGKNIPDVSVLLNTAQVSAGAAHPLPSTHRLLWAREIHRPKTSGRRRPRHHENTPI